MKNYLAALTADLIRFRSIDDEAHRPELKNIVDFVERRLRKLPGVHLQRFVQNQKHTLVATFRKNHKRPTLFLNGHLDVVPAENHQFNPRVKNGKLFGRGSHDMKGGCAVMIALIEHFARQKEKPDVGFMFVTDEEFSGVDGSKMLLNKGFRPRLLIPLEPTNLEIITETKGILWIEGTVKGKAAHGSMPWLGKNPVESFHKGLGKFYKLFPPLKKEKWRTTCNIGEVNSGDCYNRIPPQLIFKLDIRYVPEENTKKLIQKIKNCFSENTRFRIVRCDPPHDKAKNFALLDKLKKIIGTRFARAPFCTDARFFSAAGIDCAVLGAVGANMHGDNEWVDLKSLEKLFFSFKKYLEGLYG